MRSLSVVQNSRIPNFRMQNSRISWRQRVALVAVSIAYAACGTSAGSGTRVPTPTPDTSDDTGARPDTTAVDVTDPGDTRDTGPGVDGGDADGGDAGGPGDLCTRDEDCESYFCVLLQNEPPVGVCSSPCLREGDCPEGLTCVTDGAAGADRNRYCLPVDFCLDRDEDGYGVGPGCAGPDCDDDDPATNPGRIEVCNGRDTNCNGQVDENPEGINLDCETGFEGACAEGRTQCVAGLMVCQQRRTPSEEICNGLDDDCDGVIDEVSDGNPLARPCYGGAAGTEGEGVCTGGEQRCLEGRWATCEGEVVPRAEICNGLDDDCDGTIDEDVAMGESCDSGLAGQCAAGRTVCVDGATVCAADRTPAAEICNGLDDSCDGQVDRFPDGTALTIPCYSGPAATRGVGLCRDGFQPCEGGQLLNCTDQVLPIAEVCNGLDDDCDGAIDEDVPTGQLCTTGQPGICAQGARECVGGASTCVPLQAPRAELCNGVDDDCDGEVDESADGGPLTRSCWPLTASSRNVGVCRDGTEVCTDGGFSSCSGAVLPSPEVCNGLDDNCNGAVDEGVGGGACATGLPGVCGTGAIACSGAPVCTQTVFPSEELCNGLDDNCNGSVDEGVAPLACWPDGVPGRGVGACRDGTRACASGAFGTCTGAVVPSTEVCNGVDDDCDGSIDEGNPGGNAPCATGQPGICSAGRTQCSGGALACIPNESPRAELCNGIDDDCDGRIDEAPGGGPLTQSCYNGTAGTSGVGICRPGTSTCSGGAFGSCSGQVLPGSETCNGADDNCNGTTDEGCPIGLTLTSPTTSPSYGGNGGTLRTATNCAEGQVLTGINIRWGSRVDAVQAVCSSIALSTSTATTPYTYTTTTSGATLLTNWGGTGGSLTQFRCPANTAIHRFDVRHGSEIDRLQPVCARTNFTGSPGNYLNTLSNFFTGGLYGGNGGDLSSFTCPNNGLVSGFQVRSAQRVDRITFRCHRPTATLR